MADSPEDGVVDDSGRVFTGEFDENNQPVVHEDLLVCDGSIVPGSVGANPLLTITALSERICERLANRRGWHLDPNPVESAIEPPAERPISVGFTERMTGWMSRRILDDFQRAAEAGREDNSRCRFVVTIRVEDVHDWSSDPGRPVPLSGSVEMPALSDKPMVVENGQFRLLEDAPDSVDTRRMQYEMDLVTAEGETYVFEGTKTLRDDPGFDLWRDTTTLASEIRRPEAPSEVVARGLLTIRIADLARQLTTVGTHGARSRSDRLSAIATFGKTFAGKLFDIYGGVFGGPEDRRIADDARQLSEESKTRPARKRRTLRVDDPEVYPTRADDGTELLLTRYRGGQRGPVMLSHGLGVSSRIFSLDTIETNLLEYLFAHGFDVWLLDYRSSVELPAARSSYTADHIARLDYPAAVSQIRDITGVPEIDIVAHCFGSTTLMMAMLDGLAGVRSIVSSQIATHIEAPPLTDLKSGLHVPEALDALGFDRLDAGTDERADWWERLFDKALSVYPIDPEDWTDNPVAKRVNFLYGQLWEQDQLNDKTHDNLDELFGIGAIEAFEHLAKMVRAKRLVDARGSDVYLPHPERLDLPVTFIHGAENACYLPESTEKTFRWLRKHNGGGKYARHVVPRYGHIDCIFGKDAVEDVYPLILRHLKTHSTTF